MAGGEFLVVGKRFNTDHPPPTTDHRFRRVDSIISEKWEVGCFKNGRVDSGRRKRFWQRELPPQKNGRAGDFQQVLVAHRSAPYDRKTAAGAAPTFWVFCKRF